MVPRYIRTSRFVSRSKREKETITLKRNQLANPNADQKQTDDPEETTEPNPQSAIGD
jgi:hypothetical protein